MSTSDYRAQSPLSNLRCRAGKAVPAMALLILLFAPAAISQAQQPMRLAEIEVVGLKRLKEEEVITTSGLKVGQTIDPAVIDDAAEKLMHSGLFKRLSYRVRSADDQATVVFEVEEATKNLRVVFENFVWFSDAEILQAIRQDVPYFDGTSPEVGTTANKIAAALQRMLDGKKIPGTVEFMPYADLSTGRTELMFTARGVKIRVCSLHFPSASAISEADLIKASQPLLKSDYSRKDIGGFANYTLFPLYRHIGHLRAQFQPPAAGLESGQCAEGVAVTIPVDEGPPYSWGGAEWSGNQGLPAEELSAALGMKVGEVADGLKIDKGIKELRKAYGRKGYIAAVVRESSEFDASNQRVVYQFAIREGPQYHMGNLSIVGLPSGDSQRLREKWRLAPGDVFDEPYIRDFTKTDGLQVVGPIILARSRNGVRTNFTYEMKPDAEKLTVDVIITIK